MLSITYAPTSADIAIARPSDREWLLRFTLERLGHESRTAFLRRVDAHALDMLQGFEPVCVSYDWSNS